MPSQCPKCHQMLDEDYVCCADIEFQWLCSSCHKRTRGFALPFGCCPSCGGKIAMDQGIEWLKKDEGLALLQEAIQIEISGYHFYRRLACLVKDPQRKEFFQSLSDMEEGHAGELAQKYHINLLKEELFSDTHTQLPTDLFDGLTNFEKTGDMKKLYDIAIGLETKAHQFFLDKSKTLKSEDLKELCLELAAEEKDHAEMLEAEKDALKY